jgi:membrane-bound lytic murein transglycosylase MltF
MNRAICGDNRFEIIEKAKQAILEETNIKDDKAQMAELDSFLFRCWQMGWLKKYEEKETNEGQALLYAVEKTAERTKREVIKKAAEWFEKYLFDIGYPDDWCRDSRVLVSGRDRFIKAMQDESK